jgi:integrase
MEARGLQGEIRGAAGFVLALGRVPHHRRIMRGARGELHHVRTTIDTRRPRHRFPVPTPTPEGLEVTLRRSKTDQEGRGRLVALPYSGTPDLCPVRALRAWLDAAAVTGGPVFREVNRHGQVQAGALTGHTVARLVKRAAVAAGLDPAAYSGHSLRAGFVTAAKLARKDEASIMRQTGHRSVAMVRKYDRRADLWRDNAAAALLD